MGSYLGWKVGISDTKELRPSLPNLFSFESMVSEEIILMYFFNQIKSHLQTFYKSAEQIRYGKTCKI